MHLIAGSIFIAIVAGVLIGANYKRWTREQEPFVDNWVPVVFLTTAAALFAYGQALEYKEAAPRGFQPTVIDECTTLKEGTYWIEPGCYKTGGPTSRNTTIDYVETLPSVPGSLAAMQQYLN